MKAKLSLLYITFSIAATCMGQGAQNIGSLEPITFPGEYSFYSLNLWEGESSQKLYTGGFSGYMIFDADTIISGNIRSGFLGITDSLNNWIWQKKIEGPGYNQINTALFMEGEWLISGVFSDTIRMGNHELICEGYQNIFYARISSEGEYINCERISIIPAGGKQILAMGMENNIYLASEFSGEFFHQDSTYITNGTRGVVITHLNASGEIDNLKILNSNSSLSLDFFEKLADNTLLIGIGFSDTIIVDQFTITNQGERDFFISTLNQDLEFSTPHISRGGGSKKLSGAAIQQNDYLIYGEFKGEFLFQDGLFPHERGKHIFIIKISDCGDVVWEKSITGASQKNVSSLITSHNHLYVFANYRGTLSFNSNEYVTENFTYQWFIAKLSQEGEPLWLTPGGNDQNLSGDIFHNLNQEKVTLVGTNRFLTKNLFQQDLDSLERGVFQMDIVDCDFIPKPEPLSDTLFCGPGVLDAGAGYTSYIWNNTHQGQFYTIEESGLVTLEIIDKYGCSIFDTLYVEVLPEFDIHIEGDDKICPDSGLVLLHVDIDADLTWNTGSVESFQLINQEGEYYVQAVRSDGCKAEASIHVTNFEVNLPELTGYYFKDFSEPLELYPGEYAGYSWSEGQQGAVFLMESYGYPEGIYNFELEVEDWNSCLLTHEFIVNVYSNSLNTHGEAGSDNWNGEDSTILDPPGNKNNDFNNENASKQQAGAVHHGHCDFVLFPNPGSGPVTIFPVASDPNIPLQDIWTDIQVMVHGAKGEIIYRKQMATSPVWTINQDNLFAPGSYYLSLIIDKNLCRTKKFIVLP